jgi:glycosyltransferase involved in cell wall biosynthesis
LRSRVVDAVRRADRVFSVSDALRQLLIEHGASRESIQVIGNGVDLDKFRPLDQSAARETLGLPVDAKVIVSVGGLVERKGFHRVIEVMPELLRQVPHLHYVIVGGASPAGDMSMQLRDQVRRLGLDKRVHFTGPLPPERLCVPLSAADVFVLATRYEGWANVFLEAMACGLPVVTTNVGGNAEVVASENLGILVPFGDARALVAAIRNALQVRWDREQILRYARDNTWDRRVDVLVAHFRELVARATSAG